MVTKQEQLEWLANLESWPHSEPVMFMSDKSIGVYYGSPMPGCHFVSFTEWQQERDKMSSKQEVDSSWHERGELPPLNLMVEWDEWGHGNWVETKILADVGDDEFVMLIKGVKTIVGRPANFRPLRTEREMAIEEMNELVGDIEEYPTWRDAMAALYDAGYRKEASK